MVHILDVRYAPRGSPPWALKVYFTDGVSRVLEDFRPYMYVMLPKGVENLIITKIQVIARRVQEEIVEKTRKFLRNVDLDELLYVDLEEKPLYVAVTYDEKRGIYVENHNYTVYRLEVAIPQAVPRIADTILREFSGNVKVAGFNIRYTCRFMLDQQVSVLGIVPIYYVVDPEEVVEKLSQLRYLVYDVEELHDGTLIVTVLERRLLESIHSYDELEYRTETYIVKNRKDLEELEERLRKAPPVLVGFNCGRNSSEGYDNPKLVEYGLDQEVIEEKVVIDLARTARLVAQQSGVGTASFSLADVVASLRDKLTPPIPEERLKMKLRSAELLQSQDTAIRYNKNDVILTTALAELYLPSVFGIAGLFSIPPDQVAHDLRPGMIFEYAMLRWMEIHNYIPEARKVTDTVNLEELRVIGRKYMIETPRDILRGSKVYTFKDIERIFAEYGKLLHEI